VSACTCSCMRMQTQSMCTHTTGPRMQAYVCACILVLRNPNLDFLLLFLCFFYILCLCFALFACSWVTASLFIYVFALNMTRLGCSLCFLLWYHEHALIWSCIHAIGVVILQGKWGKSCIGMDLHFYMFVWCLISCLEVWNIYDD